jgi:hypothetical protein
MLLNQIQNIIAQLDKIEELFFESEHRKIDPNKVSDMKHLKAISKIINAKDTLLLALDYLLDNEEMKQLDQAKARLERLYLDLLNDDEKI